MSSRDQYGHYINERGVTFDIHQDKYGNDHVSFYDKAVDADHSGVHVNLNYGKGTWSTQTHGEGHSNSERGFGYLPK